MSAWYIGPKDENETTIFAALEAMKSEPANCDELGKDTWTEFLKSKGRWSESVAAQIIPHIFIDGGGMILVHEPKIGWEVNRCAIKVFVRQLPFVLEVFQSLKPQKELAGCVGFRGFHKKYILSEKTVQDSIETMERLIRGTESLRQELELDVQKAVQEAGAVSMRPCGCMSGMAYVDCCGKFVESDMHKEIRKQIK